MQGDVCNRGGGTAKDSLCARGALGGEISSEAEDGGGFLIREPACVVRASTDDALVNVRGCALTFLIAGNPSLAKIGVLLLHNLPGMVLWCTR